MTSAGQETDPEVQLEHPSVSNVSQLDNNSQRLLISGWKV